MHQTSQAVRGTASRVARALRAGLAASVLAACSADAEPGHAAGVVRSVSQDDVLALIEAGGPSTLLDVRTVEEFQSSHVPGAINIPVDELAARLDELDAVRESEIIVYCERGGRASTATKILGESGFDALGHLEGDMSGWRAAELPVK